MPSCPTRSYARATASAIEPARTTGGRPVAAGFSYSSDTNPQWMTIDTLREWIDQNRALIGQF